MTFSVSWVPRGVVVTYAGTVTTREVLTCHEEIAAGPAFDDLRFAIVDTLQVTTIAIGGDDVVQINAFLQGPACTNPNITVVFVATHPDVLRALAAYDAISMRAYRQQVCTSRGAARELIAGSKPNFRPRG